MAIDLSTPAKSRTKNRIDFRIDDFRKLVQQKGLRMKWEQAADCPCQLQTSSDGGLDLRGVSDINASKVGSRPDCSVCGGLGVFYHSDIEIKGIFTEASALQTAEAFGTLKQGEAKITLEPEHLPSYSDRFTLLDTVQVVREVIEINRVNALLTNIPLTHNVVNRTMTLSSGNTTTGILNAIVTDVNGVADSTDRKGLITVNANGTITLQNNLVVFPDGANLSITYYANPRYLVNGYPHATRDTFVLQNAVDNPQQLPVQCSLRLETAIERERG